jgi:hypothetical protein
MASVIGLLIFAPQLGNWPPVIVEFAGQALGRSLELTGETHGYRGIRAN